MGGNIKYNNGHGAPLSGSVQLRVISTKWELWLSKKLWFWGKCIFIHISCMPKTWMFWIIPTQAINIHLKTKMFHCSGRNRTPPTGLLRRKSENGTQYSTLTIFNLAIMMIIRKQKDLLYIYLCILFIQC